MRNLGKYDYIFVDIDGTIYQKYSFESNGKQLYYYKSRSPKDENYRPWITGENYE